MTTPRGLTMNSRTFDPGAIIYRCGDTPAAAFELRQGRVLLSTMDKDGHERTTTLGAGQIFGVAELISGGARAATAQALDEVAVSVIDRDELARLFADDSEFGKAMLRPAFEWLRWHTQPQPTNDDAPPPEAIVSRLRLRAAARELSQQIDADGIPIANLPFLVGRRSSRVNTDGGGTVDLALRDNPPYSLSRRHFAIEALDGGYAVRDCGSHHGTIVNGTRIGGANSASIAPLNAGENRIVAGRSLSPFRFVLTIEGS